MRGQSFFVNMHQRHAVVWYMKRRFFHGGEPRSEKNVDGFSPWRATEQ